jgi:hypothetical protein
MGGKVVFTFSSLLDTNSPVIIVIIVIIINVIEVVKVIELEIEQKIINTPDLLLQKVQSTSVLIFHLQARIPRGSLSRIHQSLCDPFQHLKFA